MRNIIYLSLCSILCLLACNVTTKPIVTPVKQTVAAAKLTTVKNKAELTKAIAVAVPGEEIILTNGIWKDVAINFTAKGTADQPITLRAETAGKVSMEGQSYVKFGGAYLTISGLHFKNGYTQ